MAENSIHAWWLPIIEERVRQNTLNQAQQIRASHQDILNLDLTTIKRIGSLINEGEIDADLLPDLIPHYARLLAGTESTGVDSSNVDISDLGSQQGLSNLPGDDIGPSSSHDASGSQQGLPNLPGDDIGPSSSHDASIARPSKKDLKNQRKRDKKRAKRLTENQGRAQGSAPEYPSITTHHPSAISTQIQNSEDPTIVKPTTSDISNAPEHLDDPTIAKPDISAIPSRPARLDEALISKSAISAVSTIPQHLEDPTNSKSNASDISNVSVHDDTTISQHGVPAISAISTESKHSEDPTNVKPHASGIPTGPERLDEPITTEGNISAISTGPQHPKDLPKAKANASDISTEPEFVEQPIIAKPNTSATSTEQEHHFDHPILSKSDVSAISTEPDHHFDGAAIAKPGVSVSAKQESDPGDFKTDLSTIIELGDASTFNTDQATSIKSEETPQNITSIQPDVLVAPTELDRILPEDLDNTSEDTVRIIGEGFITAAGSKVPQDISSPRIDLAILTSSKTVPKNISAVSEGSTSPKNLESTLESRTIPAALALPTAHQNTSISIAPSDVPSSSTGPGNLFGNILTENLEDKATSSGPVSAFDDAASVKSDDIDSPAEFHTPPENIGSVDFDHEEEPSGTSELGYSSTSDETATLTRETTSSEGITSIDTLIQSDSASATPQTFNALEDVNSSSIVTPYISPSTAPIHVSEVPSQIDTHTVDKPATAMIQIDDNTDLSSKEPNSTSADELIDESAQIRTADSTQEHTDYSTGNLPEASNNTFINSPTPETMGGNRDEDNGRTGHNIDDSNKESVSDSGEGNSKDSHEESHEDEPGAAASEPVSGVMGLKWAYATHTPSDNVLLANGIWLFEKGPDYFGFQPWVWRRKGLGIELAPVVIDTLGDTRDIPKAEFDDQVLYINTHMEPWQDLRAEPTHPDFQPPAKLVEYQAVESMGLSVWRHDRNLLDCRLLDCRRKVADHSPECVVCPGCGPKTSVRYCSVAHMVADLPEHWVECGHEDLVIKRVVDQSTAPAKFGRLCPAIRNSQGSKSYAMYRQGLYATLNGGRYTLFDLETEEPTVLVWTEEDVQREEMERRVERLLNFALFDHRNQTVVEFLYRMVRRCLQLKNGWGMGTMHALKLQFWGEFRWKADDAPEVAEDRVCECEWVGEGLAKGLHLPACRRLYRRLGRAFHASGMRGYLEMYEGRYWILRAWQQQHPAVGHWRDRAAGVGFEGEVEGTEPPELGPGFLVWGAEPDERFL